MRKFCLILTLIIGFSSQQAQAAEFGLGLGRMYGCLSRYDDNGKVCAMGPALSARVGFNLWGKNYKADSDKSLFSGSGSNSDGGVFHNVGHMFSHVDKWEEIVVVTVVALLMISVGYALLYPFSSRVDLGLIGQTGLQTQDDHDLSIWRNEAGVYMRGYLSQHFPIYIYGSGSFSKHTIIQGADNEDRNVFVKRAGIGIMAPQGAGPYFHGLWERSSLMDPSAKDLVEDSGTNHLRKKSVAGILDSSYFEAGWLWYF